MDDYFDKTYQAATALARKLTLDVLYEIEEHEKNYDSRFIEDLTSNLIANIVASLLYRELTRKADKKMSAEQKYDFTANNVGAIKERIQVGVSTGFQSAMSTYTGQNVEYFCMVRIVPDPVNKEPC